MINAQAAALYEAANRATRDAISFGHDPNGQRLAATRRADARALRAIARRTLTMPPCD